MRTVFGLPLAAVFSAGCVALNFGFIEKDVRADYIPDAAVPEFFNIPRPPANIAFKDDVDGNGKFLSRSFQFDSWRQSEHKRNNVIKGMLYIPEKAKAKDIFLVLPGSGEDMSAVISAESLAELGFYVMRIESGFKPFPKAIVNRALQMPDVYQALDSAAGFFREAMKQQVVDLMRLNDFLETSLKPRAIHVVGISLGGISGSLLAGVDSRVKSLMMVVSSASLARIIMDSQMSEIKRLREPLIEKFKISRDEAYAFLKEKLAPVEPINYASRINPRRVLMTSGLIDMLGLVDGVIPWSATRETWKAFGRPEWIIFPFLGHISSFLAFFPFWVEIPSFHELPQTLILDGSYARSLFKNHFLPLALQ